ncbi:MAG: hypothetical protein IPJ71_10955 [Bdellovibrionales bacterium]|nr:hypothetical protein [Bdellovibrionales bacterium]
MSQSVVHLNSRPDGENLLGNTFGSGTGYFISEIEFCQQEGLNNTTFKNWKYRLSKERTRGSTGRRKPVRCACVPVDIRKPGAAYSLPDAQWVAKLIFYLQAGSR